MAEPIIKTAGLTRRFGDLTAVSDLNIEVGRGEIFGLRSDAFRDWLIGGYIRICGELPSDSPVPNGVAPCQSREIQASPVKMSTCASI